MPETPHILFLISSPVTGTPANDNATVLPLAFRELGCRVRIAAHEDIEECEGNIRLPDATPLREFDLIWPVGFGPRASYERRLAALRNLEPGRLISAPQAIHDLHDKARWLDDAPLSFVAEAPGPLQHARQTHGGDWVLKPVAGSYGRDVHFIAAHAPASHVAQLMDAGPPGRWILQRFLPQISNGETRVLIAGTQVIGQYLRHPQDGLRANLAADANATPATCPLSEAGLAVLERVRQRLRETDIGFAAVDLCDDKLMEVNVANPGGLSTLARLYPQEHPAPAVRAAHAILKDRGLLTAPGAQDLGLAHD